METIGLAVTLELPLLILDIQRAGPSTGMPTKPEQADLLAVMFGRNAESPVPVIAASTPGGCFYAAIEATRIALKYRTPVFLLSDAYLANGSEPWLLPDVESLPDISVEFADQPNVDGDFMPYLRDPETLARQWAIPGTPGLEHRIGGLEKEDVTGNVSYDPDNHDHMVRLRAQKVAGIAADIPELEVDDPDGASLLVLGWGGTYGPIQSAARRLRKDGKNVAHAHLTHLNPFPRNLGDVLAELRQGARPRDEPRPAAEARARRVPRRRGRLQPGARAAVPLGRARRGDRGDAVTSRVDRFLFGTGDSLGPLWFGIGAFILGFAAILGLVDGHLVDRRPAPAGVGRWPTRPGDPSTRESGNRCSASFSNACVAAPGRPTTSRSERAGPATSSEPGGRTRSASLRSCRTRTRRGKAIQRRPR